MTLADDFDARIADTLTRLGCFGVSMGVGVSGGADSTALLVSLCHIARSVGFAVKAVTVNHNIREESETAGDAQSAAALCGRLAGEGYPVACTVKTLSRGEVQKAKDERGNGEEEAARYLRYRAFAEFAAENEVKYIALAHNKDDQTETILMRFLTGGSIAGIPQMRQVKECTFVRPMLSITRSEIEEYLASQGIGYRTDSTNNNTKYLRNRMRHHVMPVLDAAVPGWRAAVLGGAARVREDDEALTAAAEALKWEWKGGSEVRLSQEEFEPLPMALESRVILKAFNLLGIDDRVPHSWVRSLVAALSRHTPPDAAGHTFPAALPSFGEVTFAVDGKYLCAKKAQQVVTDFGFCVTIGSVGSYPTPLGTLEVTHDGGASPLLDRAGAREVFLTSQRRSNPCGGCVSIELCGSVLTGLRLPLLARSREAGDEVLTARGTMKSVARIMSDWKVNAADRERIPIVEAGGEVVCIWGSVLGYRDYRVVTGLKECLDM